MAHISEYHARHLARCYCRSLCRLYGSEVLSDDHMEALVRDIRALQGSRYRSVWAQLAVLPLDRIEKCLRDCTAGGSLSSGTVIWLLAFAQRGHSAVIPLALTEMEHFIIPIVVQVPAALPMGDTRLNLARRCLQRYYTQKGAEAYVEVTIQTVPSSLPDDSLVPAVEGVFDSLMRSL
jgi:hypothetical protein